MRIGWIIWPVPVDNVGILRSIGGFKLDGGHAALEISVVVEATPVLGLGLRLRERRRGVGGSEAVVRVAVFDLFEEDHGGRVGEK